MNGEIGTYTTVGHAFAPPFAPRSLWQFNSNVLLRAERGGKSDVTTIKTKGRMRIKIWLPGKIWC